MAHRELARSHAEREPHEVLNGERIGEDTGVPVDEQLGAHAVVTCRKQVGQHADQRDAEESRAEQDHRPERYVVVLLRLPGGILIRLARTPDHGPAHRGRVAPPNWGLMVDSKRLSGFGMHPDKRLYLSDNRLRLARLPSVAGMVPGQLVALKGQHLESFESTKLGRYAPRHARSRQAQAPQVLQVAELARDAPGQGIVLKVEVLQPGQGTQLGRDLAGETVLLQIEDLEHVQGPDLRGDGAGDPVPGQIQVAKVGQEAEGLGQFADLGLQGGDLPAHAAGDVDGDHQVQVRELVRGRRGRGTTGRRPGTPGRRPTGRPGTRRVRFRARARAASPGRRRAWAPAAGQRRPDRRRVRADRADRGTRGRRGAAGARPGSGPDRWTPSARRPR